MNMATGFVVLFGVGNQLPHLTFHHPYLVALRQLLAFGQGNRAIAVWAGKKHFREQVRVLFKKLRVAA